MSDRIYCCTADIAKSNMFCKIQLIQNQADEIFRELKSDNYLADLQKEVFVQKIAYYFSVWCHGSIATLNMWKPHII